ncbi:MAG: recombinase family protein [Campylobacterota bacterium]|nr:recombinase family protein [Campylobacterota bacterium]
MIVSYIRPDKIFDAAHEQLQSINAYAIANDLVINEEFVDQTSQNKRLRERTHVTQYFQTKNANTLLIYDLWVLSTNMEDVIQMISCLLKNNYNVHFVKQSVIVTQESSVMLVLGLIDQLRQTLQDESKKVIGRPKGSKSSSKFDKYINEIIQYIQANKSVSEMARSLGVSRSSLKDYIESRELKQVAFGSHYQESQAVAEKRVISTIICPNITQIGETV